MVTAARPKGVMLLSFGAPDSLDAVEPFMTNIMGGRKPPPPLTAKMIERYRLIGGKSPLPQTTRCQAALVEEILNAQGDKYKVGVGMLHWQPFIKECLREFLTLGVEELAAISLSPHFSGVTTGAYQKAIDTALSELNANLKISFGQGFYAHPLFIQGLARKIAESLKAFPHGSQVEVIFTAHSLPVAHIQGGDPYVSQLEQSVSLVTELTGIANWHLAYQSKGGGQGDWLGPEVEEVMDSLAAQGKKNVLVAPIGFATDHIETLYDIDVAQKRYAQDLGLNFHRAEALNAAPEFMQVLAETAIQAFKP